MDYEPEEWMAEEDDGLEDMPGIPVHLYSVFDDGPFQTCSICSLPLTTDEGNKLYEIKKVYQGRNVVFECAICHGCGLNLLTEYSKDSIDAIRNYFESRFKPGLSLLECHFCGRDRNPETSAVSVMAVCIGDKLYQDPVCMCDPCTEEINDNLSSKTKEVNGDFIRDYFPGVPAEWQDSPIVSL